MVYITSNQLRAASMLAAPKDLRPICRNILLEVGENGITYLVSLNGGSMFVGRLPDRCKADSLLGTQILIPHGIATLAIKSKARVFEFHRVGRDCHLNNIGFTPEDLKFPNWRMKTCPQPFAPADLQPSLIWQAHEALYTWMGKKLTVPGCTYVHQRGPDFPSTMVCTDAAAFCLIQPLRKNEASALQPVECI